MRVPAGTAKPGPAIGQALGPLGINMMDFCKKFNEETKHIVPNIPIPCVSDDTQPSSILLYSLASTTVETILLLLVYSNINSCNRSTPVAQLAPRNLLTRWDVSSIPANGIFLTKN